VYPGSFDPPTKGHLDLMERAALIFDKVVIAVANNTEKNSLFTYEERVDMIQQLTSHVPSIEVRPFKGLIIDLVREIDAIALRASLTGLGVSRITKPGQLQTPPIDWPHDGMPLLTPIARFIQSI